MHNPSSNGDGAGSNGRRSPSIIIVGAGVSGLLMGYRLLKAGITTFEILEKSDSAIGGTWRDNTYPGLACDVPAYWYSYSFEPNTEITHQYARGWQLREYLERFADKYELHPYIRLNQEVKRAQYDRGQWVVTTADGTERRADFYISATGILHIPNIAKIPGAETFEGPSFHTARWDHSVGHKGKRIGLIGTGSTAVQITSAIHSEVEKLSLFQRTPHWVIPAKDKEYSKLERWCAHHVPGYYKLRRNAQRIFFEHTFGPAVVGGQKLLDRIQEECLKFLEIVEDPELRAKLTPDYPAGCKRLIINDGFYEAVQSPAVDLVTEGIECIEPKGVRTKDGKLHEVDILVYATGFTPETILPVEVIGREGQVLSEMWKTSAEGYLSVAVSGFPNLFATLGPHSPGGNYSVISISECQTGYIMKMLEAYRAGEFDEIDVKPEAQKAFNDALQEQMKKTVWVRGCRSWYLNAEGVPIFWPWTPIKFRKDLAEVNWDDFEKRRLTPTNGATADGAGANGSVTNGAESSDEVPAESATPQEVR